MKEFFKINLLIGWMFGTLFTVLASVLYDLTELKKLFLIAIGTIIATVISVICHVIKAIFDIVKEGVRK